MSNLNPHDLVGQSAIANWERISQKSPAIPPMLSNGGSAMNFNTPNGTSSLGPVDVRFNIQITSDTTDSNGYYKCIKRDQWFAPAAVQCEMRLNTDELYFNGDQMFAEAYSHTTDSPDPLDDGFLLLRPLMVGFASAKPGCGLDSVGGVLAVDLHSFAGEGLQVISSISSCDSLSILYNTPVETVTMVCPTLADLTFAWGESGITDVFLDGVSIKDTTTKIQIGTTVQTKIITYPQGTPVGEAGCIEDPTNCCGGGTVLVDCCETPLPELLYVTFSNSGTCPYLDGLTFELPWDGVFWQTPSPIPVDCFAISEKYLTLTCIGSTWTFAISGSAWNLLTISCDPFELTFDKTISEIGCCTGTITATITS